MDKVDSSTRSRIMSRVKSSGNKSTERKLRAHLARAGIRGWRIQPKGVIGKPDFVFDSPKLAIFVHGCFWHGCPSCCRMPSSRKEYWQAKITGNMQRDGMNYERLVADGWGVLTVWEHDLKSDPLYVVACVMERLSKNS